MLIEELGAVPSPSHSWMAPLVEDMLHDIRTGLTEAVVIGPGRAVLFYGKCSLGEGLTTDETGDSAFLHTGAGMWVGKPAYLAAGPMTIQEGWWAISQAITDCWVKARRQDIHMWICWPNNPSDLTVQEVPPWRMSLGMVVPNINHHHIGPQEAKTTIDIRETKGLHHLSSHCLSQIVGLTVTGPHYQWLPWCHPGLIDQMDPGIPDEGDSNKRMELTWR